MRYFSAISSLIVLNILSVLFLLYLGNVSREIEKQNYTLEKKINFKFSNKNILVTFHPVTLEVDTAKKQFENLLYALDKLKETKIIFTMPNSDTEGRIIQKLITNYVNKNK